MWWHPGMAEELVSWLERRIDAFPHWVNTWSPQREWDYSPESLSALDELVRHTTPDKETLNSLPYTEFRDGAIWYYGEVLRRGLRGRWTTRDGKPYIDDLGQRKQSRPRPGDGCAPDAALVVALEEPGYLRTHYSYFVDVEAWVTERERQFPEWIARYGKDVTWDFSVESLDSLALMLLRRYATPTEFNARAAREFGEGAVWYLGEAMRRHEQEQWPWRYREDKNALKRFQLQAPWDADRQFPPHLRLNNTLEYGNPLVLRPGLPGARHTGAPQPDFYTAGVAGREWTDREDWVGSIAELFENLTATYLPDDIVLDYSSESLRRVAEFTVNHSGDEPDFIVTVAAYLGEMLRRVGRGQWIWTDQPLVDFRSVVDRVSPTELVCFARDRQDASILTHIHAALHRRVSTRESKRRPPGVNRPPSATT